MPNPDPATLRSLEHLVLAGGVAVGLVFGAAASMSRFCTMGAIADLCTFGDAARLRLWVWSVLVALLGTQALRAAGLVHIDSAVQLSPHLPWLSLVLGGLAFGWGMVYASGCPSRALVRAGEGNFKAIVVLLGVGLAAQMTLRGVFAGPRVHGLDAVRVVLEGPQDLPAIAVRAAGGSVGLWQLLLCAAVVVPTAAWLFRDRAFRRPLPVLAGLAIGGVVVAGWWLTAGVGYLAEHPETLERAWLGTQSRRAEAVSFVAPTAHLLDLLTLWSDSSTRLGFGVCVLLGVVAGSAAATAWRGDFRTESFRDAADLRRHGFGAALMGIGGVTALGCSIGQGVSGLSTFSLGSIIAVAGMVGGAWGALRYLAWRMDVDD